MVQPPSASVLIARAAQAVGLRVVPARPGLVAQLRPLGLGKIEIDSWLDLHDPSVTLLGAVIHRKAKYVLFSAPSSDDEPGMVYLVKLNFPQSAQTDTAVNSSKIEVTGVALTELERILNTLPDGVAANLAATAEATATTIIETYKTSLEAEYERRMGYYTQARAILDARSTE